MVPPHLRRRSDLVVALSEGQRIALAQLQRIADTDQSPVRIIDHEETRDPVPRLEIDITLDCTHYPRVDGGLPLHDREGVTLSVPADFPFKPPSVYTPHTRFLGYPHVQWDAFCACTSLRTPSGSRLRVCSGYWHNWMSGFGAVPEMNSMIRKGLCIRRLPTQQPRPRSV